MKTRNSIRSLAVVGGVLGSVVAANAIFIDPVKLQTSGDGPGLNVQSLLASNGYTSSVGTVVPFYGDQSDNEIYALNQDNAVWSIIWQNAGFASGHKLGYYTNVADATNLLNITWVLGDLDNNTGTAVTTTSAPINLNQVFGLAFFSGDGAGTLFYSQTFRNSDTDPLVKDHAASINAIPTPAGFQSGVVVSWEDSLNNIIDKDYNDFGTLITGARAVPEPASLAALGLGALALIRRRRAKK
ncbi:MAG: PEP-CTERM sorting domain-containing protein [Chlorobia bacterium]|nr:PEP-CTERM sorting domain-containing protein [Fimbriimonadaceae bacterium]